MAVEAEDSAYLLRGWEDWLSNGGLARDHAIIISFDVQP